jgi:hypothetical protein
MSDIGPAMWRREEDRRRGEKRVGHDMTVRSACECSGVLARPGEESMIWREDAT